MVILKIERKRIDPNEGIEIRQPAWCWLSKNFLNILGKTRMGRKE